MTGCPYLGKGDENCYEKCLLARHDGEYRECVGSEFDPGVCHKCNKQLRECKCKKERSLLDPITK